MFGHWRLARQQDVHFASCGANLRASLQLKAELLVGVKCNEWQQLLQNVGELKLHRRFFVDIDEAASNLPREKGPRQGDSASHPRGERFRLDGVDVTHIA